MNSNEWIAQRLKEANALKALQQQWDAAGSLGERWRFADVEAWWAANLTDWDREFLIDGQANWKISPQ